MEAFARQNFEHADLYLGNYLNRHASKKIVMMLLRD